ncbi:hypothetical protein, partial [Klebsiella oxytoca]
MNVDFEPDDYDNLKKAVAILESPPIIARLSNMLGSPLEAAVKKLPPSVSGKLNSAVEAALH